MTPGRRSGFVIAGVSMLTSAVGMLMLLAMTWSLSLELKVAGILVLLVLIVVLAMLSIAVPAISDPADDEYRTIPFNDMNHEYHCACHLALAELAEQENRTRER